jgi:hypothetical protein
MKHQTFNARDLAFVIELLDDISFARDTTFMKKRICVSALGALIRENRKVKEFAYIENFIEKQKHLPLDVGTRLRSVAEELGDWCRDQLEGVE